MWNVRTKGYIHYFLGLKTLYYMSISWESTFKKNKIHFNRHELRSARNSAILQGQSVMHIFEATVLHMFSRPQSYACGVWGCSKNLEHFAISFSKH